MAHDHDPLEDSSDGDSPVRSRSPFGSPRFARLVRSPVARRLSPRRLAAGLVLVVLAGWGVFQVGSRAVSSVGHWVANQPEHLIPFAEIELDPPPPSYIHQGAAGILESVRAEGKYAESISLLETNLESLRVDMSRNLWVERVGPIRSTYGRLVVKLAYRQPLAIIPLEDPNLGVVIDRNGVELPSRWPGQFEWAEKSPRVRPAGVSKPLMVIRGLGLGQVGRVGLVWKPTDPKIDDDKVIEAARLAEFVADHIGTNTPGGKKPTPDFVEIEYWREERPGGPVSGFFLHDSKQNPIWWKSAPGSEHRGEPSAAKKWAMLATFLDDHSPLNLNREAGEYLRFTSDRAEIFLPTREKPVRKSGRPGHF